MQLQKNYLFLILFFILSMCTICAQASPNKSMQKLKIAILDSFTTEKFAQKYKNGYFSGINTATVVAKTKGFIIEYKTFTYGNKPLDILATIPEVKKWKPHLIIGPHSSNHFLLMQKYFKDVLAISPYATDEAIRAMSKNFYSLSYPDSHIAKATIAFLKNKYPGRNIFHLTQADCKDCYDITNIFSKIYKEKNPNASIINSYYIGNDISNLDIKKLMSQYIKESIIILQPLSYSDANLLIPLIINNIKQNKTTFIHNLDNWGNADEARKSIASIDYSIFRVCPFIENKQSKIYQKFIDNYKKTFNSTTPTTVSFMTYATVMAVIDALLKSPNIKKDNLRSTILLSFQAALKRNPNWYRAEGFTYYELTETGEKRQDIIRYKN